MAAQTLIANMGLFWRKNSVYWGAGSNAGHLKGFRNGARDRLVDFRHQRGIYVLYSDFQIVYIGQAGRGNASLFGRLKAHTRDDLAERWDRFSWFGLDRVLTSGGLAAPTMRASPTTSTILNHIEGILIHASEPPLNRQRGSFGKSVRRYLQWRDDQLGPTPDQASKDTNREIKELYDLVETLRSEM